MDSFTLLTAELTAELTARQKQYEFYRDELLKVDDSIKTVALEEIADIGTGSSNTNEGLEEGLYPFYVRSQEPLRKNEYEYDETAIITAGDGVGVGKVYHYVEGKYALHQRAYRIHINTPDVLPKYYFYYMKSAFLPYIQKSMFQGSVASIRRPMLNKFPVPVPSIEVQQKIINVLENFDAICSDLNIGLPAEIEARQKQYEYYRDALLTYAATGKIITRQTDRQTDKLNALIKLCQYVFGKVFVKLSDLFDTRNGYTPSKSNSEFWNGETSIPWFRMEDIRANGRILNSALQNITPKAVKGKLFPENSIIISTSATIGEYALITVPSVANQRFTYLMLKKEFADKVNIKYLLYYCNKLSEFCKANLNQGNFASVDMTKFNNFKFALPTLEEQQRIVSILDRFDALCNDISTGLPAEIEARQKQYEYYRDKLFNFKKLEQ